MTTKLSTIGRPGIGGEFFSVEHVGHGRYRLIRMKKASSTREEVRQCNVEDLPADTLIYDLLTAIEEIERDAEERGRTVDLDFKGIAGGSTTLRERFARLSWLRDGRNFDEEIEELEDIAAAANCPFSVATRFGAINAEIARLTKRGQVECEEAKE